MIARQRIKRDRPASGTIDERVKLTICILKQSDIVFSNTSTLPYSPIMINQQPAIQPHLTRPKRNLIPN